MKPKKLIAVVLLFMVAFTLPQSCGLFEEESPCGKKKNIFVDLVNNPNTPVKMENFVSQDGIYSYYTFEFPGSLSALQLCIEEHCKLSCMASFKDNLSQNLKNMKVEGMIDIGFYGSPMIFEKNGADYSCENEIGLQQSFGHMDYGWIYGRVKISFETYGTPEEEIDILNQLLRYISVDFDYHERKL